MSNKFLIFASFIVSLLLVSGSYSNHSYQPNIKPINPDSISGSYDPNDTNATFLDKKLTTHQLGDKSKKVLGVRSGEKRIEVDLSKQKLYAYENNKLVYEFLISSGKWGRTPTGIF